jgi:hypothetical protein
MNQKELLRDDKLQALQNAVTSLKLTGFEVLSAAPIQKGKYCLRDSNQKCLTGWWDYNSLNHFILGYGKAWERIRRAI